MAYERNDIIGRLEHVMSEVLVSIFDDCRRDCIVKVGVVNIRLQEFGAVDSEALHDRHSLLILSFLFDQVISLGQLACGVRLRARGMMKVHEGCGGVLDSDIIFGVR